MCKATSTTVMWRRCLQGLAFLACPAPSSLIWTKMTKAQCHEMSLKCCEITKILSGVSCLIKSFCWIDGFATSAEPQVRASCRHTHFVLLCSAIISYAACHSLGWWNSVLHSIVTPDEGSIAINCLAEWVVDSCSPCFGGQATWMALSWLLVGTWGHGEMTSSLYKAFKGPFKGPWRAFRRPWKYF